MSDEPREPAPPEPSSPSEPPAPAFDPAAPAASESPPVVASEPASPGSTPEPATAPPARAPRRPSWHEERPETTIEVPRATLATRSRRDFLLLVGGVLASVVGAWWLLPDRTKGRLVGEARRDDLDSLAARVGLSRGNREKVLDRTLTFDDDVAEALYSKDRSVRNYRKSEVTRLRNNYHGATPGPEIVPGWRLNLRGLASGRDEAFTVEDLLARLPFHEQVTRLVCVEGWSAIAWWGGIRFADLLAALPPAPGAHWAAMRSSVSLDGAGRLEPYYVSIDLPTAHHPQTLLATHQDGNRLSLAHGAPLRLLAPMKLGLKNIKALTDIEYVADEPPDYWAEQSYSKYDGL
jgi:DMSO/TMAO reductase YedYZ molybdopterin-dependent catalytic subunit